MIETEQVNTFLKCSSAIFHTWYPAAYCFLPQLFPLLPTKLGYLLSFSVMVLALSAYAQQITSLNSHVFAFKQVVLHRADCQKIHACGGCLLPLPPFRRYPSCSVKVCSWMQSWYCAGQSQLVGMGDDTGGLDVSVLSWLKRQWLRKKGASAF